MTYGVEKVSLLVSSGNGPAECRQAVGHVLSQIAKEAAAAGVDVDESRREADHGPSSAVLVLGGAGAGALAARWVGSILWRCQSQIRPKHKRKNWFVQVFELSDGAPGAEIREADVEMQALRAGGPGGQHQNKTSSAIQARWVAPDGRRYQVFVRDQRSQHQNRRLALSRLQALVDLDQREAEEARAAKTHRMHHQLERGNPVRRFQGPRFRKD